MSVKGDIVKDILRRFPKVPVLTAAKKAYKENPTVFKDVEDARNVVRYHIDQQPNDRGYSVKDKSFAREKTYNYNPFNLPESHADTFEPYLIKQKTTILLKDTHFPYQHNQAIEAALKYAKDRKPDCILLNGDVIDFAPISRHEKDWRQRTVGQEFESVRLFFKALRTNFPNTKIVYKLGNHDERWEKWLVAKAPELLDCSDFELEVILRLGELHIDIVKDKRPIGIGKLTALHGHEMAGGSGGVNPARSAFLKTLSNVVIGHFHRTSEHTESALDGSIISVNSVGCLCGLHPKYMPINKWNLGFAYCELDVKTGEYELENLKIINGKIYK